MAILRPRSLAATLDAANEALFFGRKIDRSEGFAAAEWIAARQGLKGSYSGMFAPTEFDFKQGFRVFTGERFKSRAGTGCKLGNEAARTLLLLDAHGEFKDALSRAAGGMEERLQGTEGRYCCGSCSVAVWRNLLAGGLSRSAERLANGLKELKAYRDGKGKWRSFPFWYTLLALSEMDLPAVKAELRYAAPAVERALARRVKRDKYDARRREVAERILAKA